MSDNTTTTNQRNGYDIRTDLLGMAIGILESQNNRREQNEHFQAENDKSYKRQTITPYAPEDVITTAEKLYGFVQKKD